MFSSDSTRILFRVRCNCYNRQRSLRPANGTFGPFELGAARVNPAHRSVARGLPLRSGCMASGLSYSPKASPAPRSVARALPLRWRHTCDAEAAGPRSRTPRTPCTQPLACRHTLREHPHRGGKPGAAGLSLLSAHPDFQPVWVPLPNANAHSPHE